MVPTYGMRVGRRVGLWVRVRLAPARLGPGQRGRRGRSHPPWLAALNRNESRGFGIGKVQSKYGGKRVFVASPSIEVPRTETPGFDTSKLPLNYVSESVAAASSSLLTHSCKSLDLGTAKGWGKDRGKRGMARPVRVGSPEKVSGFFADSSLPLDPTGGLCLVPPPSTMPPRGWASRITQVVYLRSRSEVSLGGARGSELPRIRPSRDSQLGIT